MLNLMRTSQWLNMNIPHCMHVYKYVYDQSQILFSMIICQHFPCEHTKNHPISASWPCYNSFSSELMSKNTHCSGNWEMTSRNIKLRQSPDENVHACSIFLR